MSRDPTIETAADRERERVMNGWDLSGIADAIKPIVLNAIDDMMRSMPRTRSDSHYVEFDASTMAEAIIDAISENLEFVGCTEHVDAAECRSDAICEYDRIMKAWRIKTYGLTKSEDRIAWRPST